MPHLLFYQGVVTTWYQSQRLVWISLNSDWLSPLTFAWHMLRLLSLGSTGPGFLSTSIHNKSSSRTIKVITTVKCKREILIPEVNLLNFAPWTGQQPVYTELYWHPCNNGGFKQYTIHSSLTWQAMVTDKHTHTHTAQAYLLRNK